MNKILDILKWLLPLVVLLATSCGHDDIVMPDVYVEEEPPYVELRIAVPAANPFGTRANPAGGEDGNGREQGVLNEDIIHDINVYFYRDSNRKGLNSPSDTEILGHFFYNLDNENDVENSQLLPDTELVEGKPSANNTNYYYGTQYVTLKFKCSAALYDKAKNICFLAIANIGKIQFKDNMTLGDLRDIQLDYYSNSWNKAYDEGSMNAEKMNYFLMSTAYSDEYTYGGLSTGNNRINTEGTGTTTLQRLYARIDLSYSHIKNEITSNGKVSELGYQVVDLKDNDIKNAAGEVIDRKVYLTNVLPVNVMQKPSYLFKKVTLGIESFDLNSLKSLSAEKYLWGGKEDPDGNGSMVSGPGDKPTNYVLERYTDQKNQDGEGSLQTWYGKTGISYVSGLQKYENQDCSISNTAIGSLAGYYHGKPNSGNDENERISIISYANENTHPTDCFHRNYLTGMAFRAVYVPEVIYDGYEEKTVDGNTTNVLTLLDQSVESIAGGKIYRYSPTGRTQSEGESLYFSNKKAVDDYVKDHPDDMAILTEFTAIPHGDRWGFICYYNLWLRHYNDVNDTNTDPHPHLPMEYATVRNNIYRVSVSFTGPGDPSPTMREPDTMKARIFVRKWNYREEEEIIF